MDFPLAFHHRCLLTAREEFNKSSSKERKKKSSSGLRTTTRDTKKFRKKRDLLASHSFRFRELFFLLLIVPVFYLPIFACTTENLCERKWDIQMDTLTKKFYSPGGSLHGKKRHFAGGPIQKSMCLFLSRKL